MDLEQKNMKRRIRLLCCIHDLRGRGAEKVLSILLEKFDRNKFHIGLFVYHNKFSTHVPDDIDTFSADISADPRSNGLFSKIISFFLKVVAAGRVLKKFKPDVVFCVAGTNLSVIVARYIYYRKAKIVLSEHVIESIYISYTMKGIAKYGLKRLISLLYPLSELIIVPLKGISDDLSQNYGVSNKKIRVIPNPLDIQKVQILSKMSPPLTVPSNDSYIVGFVGSLSWEKNLSILLKAFSILKNKGISVKLLVVGDGPEREKLQRISQELGIASYVHFIGYQDNPYMFMAHFDVLVLPSLYETFSYVSIEAMTCGVPVISTKWYGCEEIYYNMYNCILVSINNSEELAEAIFRVLMDDELKNKLTKNAMELVAKCDVSRVVPQYEKAIINVSETVNP